MEGQKYGKFQEDELAEEGMAVADLSKTYGTMTDHPSGGQQQESSFTIPSASTAVYQVFKRQILSIAACRMRL